MTLLLHSVIFQNSAANGQINNENYANNFFLCLHRNYLVEQFYFRISNGNNSIDDPWHVLLTCAFSDGQRFLEFVINLILSYVSGAIKFLSSFVLEVFTKQSSRNRTYYFSLMQ